MQLHEFLKLVEEKEDFFLVVHKGEKESDLLNQLEYVPPRDPELFFVDVNTSDGAQIALECSVVIYPSFLSFEGGKIRVKEWIHAG